MKILDKYSSHHWLLNDTYNTLISAVGERFDNLTPRELASITQSLARVHIRQDDVISQALNKVKELTVNHKVSFNKIIAPFFTSMADLNLADTESFKMILEEDFIKKSCFGDLSFIDQVKRD